MTQRYPLRNKRQRSPDDEDSTMEPPKKVQKWNSSKAPANEASADLDVEIYIENQTQSTKRRRKLKKGSISKAAQAAYDHDVIGESDEDSDAVIMSGASAASRANAVSGASSGADDDNDDAYETEVAPAGGGGGDQVAAVQAPAVGGGGAMVAAVKVARPPRKSSLLLDLPPPPPPPKQWLSAFQHFHDQSQGTSLKESIQLWKGFADGDRQKFESIADGDRQNFFEKQKAYALTPEYITWRNKCKKMLGMQNELLMKQESIYMQDMYNYKQYRKNKQKETSNSNSNDTTNNQTSTRAANNYNHHNHRNIAANNGIQTVNNHHNNRSTHGTHNNGSMNHNHNQNRNYNRNANKNNIDRSISSAAPPVKQKQALLTDMLESEPSKSSSKPFEFNVENAIAEFAYKQSKYDVAAGGGNANVGPSSTTKFMVNLFRTFENEQEFQMQYEDMFPPPVTRTPKTSVSAYDDEDEFDTDPFEDIDEILEEEKKRKQSVSPKTRKKRKKIRYVRPLFSDDSMDDDDESPKRSRSAKKTQIKSKTKKNKHSSLKTESSKKTSKSKKKDKTGKKKKKSETELETMETDDMEAYKRLVNKTPKHLRQRLFDKNGLQWMSQILRMEDEVDAGAVNGNQLCSSDLAFLRENADLFLANLSSFHYQYQLQCTRIRVCSIIIIIKKTLHARKKKEDNDDDRG